MATTLYDSQQSRTRVSRMPLVLLRERRLLALLVRRDIVARYKRSAFGLLWTLLKPVLEMTVLYLVFSHLFLRASLHVPYVSYLLSGLILSTLFRDTVTGVASSMVDNTALLSRIYVPVELFAAAAALVVLLNFVFSLAPLAVVMLITGTHLAPTVLLGVIPAVLLAGTAAGIGLAMAPAAVRYRDLLHLVGILLTLVAYLAPIFYPFSIIPPAYRFIVRMNPLYHGATAFRSALFGTSLGPASHYVFLLGSASVALGAGAWVLSRFGRRTVIAL